MQSQLHWPFHIRMRKNTRSPKMSALDQKQKPAECCQHTPRNVLLIKRISMVKGAVDKWFYNQQWPWWILLSPSSWWWVANHHPRNMVDQLPLVDRLCRWLSQWLIVMRPARKLDTTMDNKVYGLDESSQICQADDGQSTVSLWMWLVCFLTWTGWIRKCSDDYHDKNSKNAGWHNE